MADKKPSTKDGKDPAASYGKGPKQKGYSSGGNFASALAKSKAAYQKDPTARYTSHDGE